VHVYRNYAKSAVVHSRKKYKPVFILRPEVERRVNARGLPQRPEWVVQRTAGPDYEPLVQTISFADVVPVGPFKLQNDDSIPLSVLSTLGTSYDGFAFLVMGTVGSANDMDVDSGNWSNRLHLLSDSVSVPLSFSANTGMFYVHDGNHTRPDESDDLFDD
jgi:hypothetical protein